MEHEVTRKLLQTVACDHFIAKRAVQERVDTLYEKRKLWEHEIQIFAATKIQRGWRSQKAIRNTRLRILLSNRNKNDCYLF